MLFTNGYSIAPQITQKYFPPPFSKGTYLLHWAAHETKLVRKYYDFRSICVKASTLQQTAVHLKSKQLLKILSPYFCTCSMCITLQYSLCCCKLTTLKNTLSLPLWRSLPALANLLNVAKMLLITYPYCVQALPTHLVLVLGKTPQMELSALPFPQDVDAQFLLFLISLICANHSQSSILITPLLFWF